MQTRGVPPAPHSPVGSDLTFPCSLYQAGPEARAVVGGSLTALGDSPVMVGSGGPSPRGPHPRPNSWARAEGPGPGHGMASPRPGAGFVVSRKPPGDQALALA